jgi:transposase
MRFASAIFEAFGVRYDPDHVGRIMHRLGLRARRKRNQIQEMPALIQQAS